MAFWTLLDFFTSPGCIKTCLGIFATASPDRAFRSRQTSPKHHHHVPWWSRLPASAGRQDWCCHWCWLMWDFLKMIQKKSPWVSMLRKSHPWLGWCGVPPWCMSNLVHKFDERPGHSWIGCRISLKHVKTLGLRDNPQYFMGKTVFGQTHR